MDDATLTLFDILGAAALLLWGLHMSQSGIQRAYGANLKRGLARGLGNRFTACAAGLGTGAILQSGTKAGAMITAFAAEGPLTLVPALAVMLGANLGSTLSVQLLSFDIARSSPLFILIGVMMFARQGAPRTRDLGRSTIGVGLILLALGLLAAALADYEDIPSLRLLVGAIATAPIIALLVGAALSWAAHSSIAIVLLVIPFVTKGVISFDSALALALGANLGPAFHPVIEAPVSGDRTGKQVAIGNLLMRLAGATIAFPVIPWIGSTLAGLDPGLGRGVANFYTLFNLGLACLCLPFLGIFARLLRHWMQPYFEVPDPSRALHLDAAARDVAPLALGCAIRETLRMVDILDEMLQGTRTAFQTNDTQLFSDTRRMSDHLDRLSSAIQSYLTAIDPDSLTGDDDKSLSTILAFTSNLNHAGDILERNMLANAAKQLKRGQMLSPETKASIDSGIDRLAQNLQTASAIFMTGDARAARVLVAERAVFRDLETKAMEMHFQYLRTHKAEGLETCTLYLDLVRNLKTINDRFLAGTAYLVLDELGDFRATRLGPKSPAPRGKNDPGGQRS